VSVTPIPLGSGDPESSREGERLLVTRLREGDRDAAESLVEQTYSMVWASLIRLCGGDRETAADLCQETYRKAWESLASFDGRALFSTWLYRIAYTTFLNHIRRPHRVVPLEENDFTDPAIGADERVARRESRELLRHAVLALPEDLRFTVSAHFWGELSVREVAELEGISTVAVRKRLNRAYSLIGARYEGQSK
jgi:RNA polymerase sigma-70 factor, ECF subfamily